MPISRDHRGLRGPQATRHDVRPTTGAGRPSAASRVHHRPATCGPICPYPVDEHRREPAVATPERSWAHRGWSPRGTCPLCVARCTSARRRTSRGEQPAVPASCSLRSSARCGSADSPGQIQIVACSRSRWPLTWLACTPRHCASTSAKGFLQPERSDGGTRRYSGADVERLRLIADLTTSGLNLAGVKRVARPRDRARRDDGHHRAPRCPDRAPAKATTRSVGGGVEGNSGDEGFSDEQRSGLDARRADHDRTLEAIHRLEAALGEAAPGREAPWRDEVLEALSVLEAATAEEADNGGDPTACSQICPITSRDCAIATGPFGFQSGTALLG